jgi:hypothetical protein
MIKKLKNKGKSQNMWIKTIVSRETKKENKIFPGK